MAERVARRRGLAVVVEPEATRLPPTCGTCGAAVGCRQSRPWSFRRGPRSRGRGSAARTWWPPATRTSTRAPSWRRPPALLGVGRAPPPHPGADAGGGGAVQPRAASVGLLAGRGTRQRGAVHVAGGRGRPGAAAAPGGNRAGFGPQAGPRIVPGRGVGQRGQGVDSGRRIGSVVVVAGSRVASCRPVEPSPPGARRDHRPRRERPAAAGGAAHGVRVVGHGLPWGGPTASAAERAALDLEGFGLWGAEDFGSHGRGCWLEPRARLAARAGAGTLTLRLWAPRPTSPGDLVIRVAGRVVAGPLALGRVPEEVLVTLGAGDADGGRVVVALDSVPYLPAASGGGSDARAARVWCWGESASSRQPCLRWPRRWSGRGPT